MILLEIENLLVRQTLEHRFAAAKAVLSSGEKQRFDNINLTFADFDGALYMLSNPEGDTSRILVSIRLKFFKELQEYGANDLLRQKYGKLLRDRPVPEYSVTLEIDLRNLPENTTELVHSLGLLKRNCFASVFETYFEAQASGAQKKDAVIHYRDDETMYVQALPDRVVVIFSTVFKDADDVIIGKLFLQEFVEVRRRVNQAPQVLYKHKSPPTELEGTAAAVGDNVAYITFVLFPRHTNESVRDNTINLIHTLRNYLHYHIKCSKGMIHMRMRAKSAEFLKVLKRAQPDTKGDKVGGQKTISGRAFIRN